MAITQILKGHSTPETAYIVNDYPYGFRLRCKIRYWLEENKNGARLWSQTTNPKKAGEVWNKPKASTYAYIGGCMYLNEEGHVAWSGLNEYSDLKEAEAWFTTYSAGLSEEATKRVNTWIEKKRAYEASKQPVA
jgi:hypothetical protein